MLKAAYRLMAARLKAANDTKMFQRLKDKLDGKVSTFAIPDGIVLDANLKSAIGHMEKQGWEVDSDGLHYAIMTDDDGCSVRLQEDTDEAHVTIKCADHPDPHDVAASNAQVTYADPSGMHDDSFLGDTKCLRMTNSTIPPSISVLGGGGAIGGDGGVLPEPIDELGQKLKEEDADKPVDMYSEDSLEVPGTPDTHSLAPEGNDLEIGVDGPVFMADQPWGHATRAPNYGDDFRSIKDVAEDAGTLSAPDEDLPVGTHDGTLMATGITLTASARLLLAKAIKAATVPMRGAPFNQQFVDQTKRDSDYCPCCGSDKTRWKTSDADGTPWKRCMNRVCALSDSLSSLFSSHGVELTINRKTTLYSLDKASDVKKLQKWALENAPAFSHTVEIPKVGAQGTFNTKWDGVVHGKVVEVHDSPEDIRIYGEVTLSVQADSPGGTETRRLVVSPKDIKDFRLGLKPGTMVNLVPGFIAWGSEVKNKVKFLGVSKERMFEGKLMVEIKRKAEGENYLIPVNKFKPD